MSRDAFRAQRLAEAETAVREAVGAVGEIYGVSSPQMAQAVESERWWHALVNEALLIQMASR